jgi:hypothetical protein
VAYELRYHRNSAMLRFLAVGDERDVSEEGKVGMIHLERCLEYCKTDSSTEPMRSFP